MILIGTLVLLTLLLTNLKDNFPTVNFISYRVVESRDVSSVHTYYTGNYSEINKKKWAKERSAILNTTGYDAMYAIASTSLNQSDDFQVADDATTAQIEQHLRSHSSPRQQTRKFFLRLPRWSTDKLAQRRSNLLQFALILTLLLNHIAMPRMSNLNSRLNEDLVSTSPNLWY